MMPEVIHLRARTMGNDPGSVPWAGSLNTAAAQCWRVEVTDCGDGTGEPRADEAVMPGRIWLTPSGRWALTTRDWDCYLTTNQARHWLIHNGYHDVVRDHIDRPRDREGRPEIGPEVKTRLPETTIAAVDRLAQINGLSRAAQLRALVMDAIAL